MLSYNWNVHRRAKRVTLAVWTTSEGEDRYVITETGKAALRVKKDETSH
jgi:hypothetical protein